MNTQVVNGSKIKRIAELNDNLRKSREGGMTLFSSGFQALPVDTRAKAFGAIMAFSDFNEGNDPHKERDFCAVEVDGHRIFWKCDYYDIDIRYGSDDPSDASQTKRVATIYLAEEH